MIFETMKEFVIICSLIVQCWFYLFYVVMIWLETGSCCFPTYCSLSNTVTLGSKCTLNCTKNDGLSSCVKKVCVVQMCICGKMLQQYLNSYLNCIKVCVYNWIAWKKMQKSVKYKTAGFVEHVALCVLCWIKDYVFTCY